MHGHIHVLLGCDITYDCWSDFGGKCEWVDNNDPMKTAAREFFEETSGIVSSELALYNQLKKEGICLNCKSYNQHDYYMYLLPAPKTPTDMNSYVHDFENQQRLLKHRPLSHDIMRYVEKCKLRWFRLEDILTNPSHMRFRSVFLESIRNNITVIQEQCVLV